MTDQELLNRLSDALDHAAPDDLDVPSSPVAMRRKERL